MPQTELFGKLQVLERKRFLHLIESFQVDLIEDEASDLFRSSEAAPISRCIKRPDGISLSAYHSKIQYELQFNPEKPEFGAYTITGGIHQGSGRIVGVRRAETASFSDYYYVKVVSTTSHHFIWRVGIFSYSKTVLPHELE